MNLLDRTKLILGGLGLVVAIAFVLVSMGKAQWANMMALIGSAFLGLFLLSEGAFLQYVQSSGYKKLGLGDLIVLLSFVIGAIMIAQALLLFAVVQNNAPAWLLTFLSAQGIVIGILASLLFLYHMFAPKPR